MLRLQSGVYNTHTHGFTVTMVTVVCIFVYDCVSDVDVRTVHALGLWLLFNDCMSDVLCRSLFS